MALIQPIFAISAALSQSVTNAGNYLNQAAGQCNLMSQRLLSLPNQELQDWLNSQSVIDVQQLFSDHLTVGTDINSALTRIVSQQTASGIVFNAGMVDVREFSVKLAEQNRQAQYVDGAWVVSDIPPPPTPPE